MCERHNPGTLALIVEDADGSVRNWTFGELLAGSSRLANALQAKGVGKGDRVGVFLSQGAELTLCHLAGYRMGAVVLPLFTLFGEEAVEYRLANAGAKAVVPDMANVPQILAVRDRLLHLETIYIVIGAERAQCRRSSIGTWLLDAASDSFATLDTDAEDPALADLHFRHDGPGPRARCMRTAAWCWAPSPQWSRARRATGHAGNEIMWTPAEWALIAGLYDALFPAWYYGTPVPLAIALPKFDPERAFAMLAKHRVGVTFIPPTSPLKMMREVDPAEGVAGTTTCAPSSPAAKPWARNCWLLGLRRSAPRSRRLRPDRDEPR